MNALLRAQDLDIGHAGVPVVHGIDLKARAGEVLTVLGANGAGKTTLLLGLAGALPILNGTVHFDGRPVSGVLSRNARHGLGLLTDDRAVFRDLTVGENLRLGRGDPEVALSAFPALKPLVSRRAGLLSGGEQQMLGLGRIIAGRPRVLLADELSMGLSPLVADSLLKTVRLMADDGAAVVLVEQQINLVLDIADHAIVLRRGRVVVSETADELRRDPHRVVRAYLHESVDHDHDADVSRVDV